MVFQFREVIVRTLELVHAVMGDKALELAMDMEQGRKRL
jgi:hypothetical protein